MHDWNNPRAVELVAEVYSKYGAMMARLKANLNVLMDPSLFSVGWAMTTLAPKT
jgi:hypothetical protein